MDPAAAALKVDLRETRAGWQRQWDELVDTCPPLEADISEVRNWLRRVLERRRVKDALREEAIDDVIWDGTNLQQLSRNDIERKLYRNISDWADVKILAHDVVLAREQYRIKHGATAGMEQGHGDRLFLQVLITAFVILFLWTLASDHGLLGK